MIPFCRAFIVVLCFMTVVQAHAQLPLGDGDDGGQEATFKVETIL